MSIFEGLFGSGIIREYENQLGQSYQRQQRMSAYPSPDDYAQRQFGWTDASVSAVYNNSLSAHRVGRYRSTIPEYRESPRHDCRSCGAPWKQVCDYCGREG